MSSCRGCCLVVKMLGIVSNVVPKLVQRNFRNSLMPCHQTRRQHGGRGSSGWRLGRGQEEDMEIIFSLMRITPSTAPPLVGSVPQCLRCMVCGGWRELADVVFYKRCKLNIHICVADLSSSPTRPLLVPRCVKSSSLEDTVWITFRKYLSSGLNYLNSSAEGQGSGDS